MLRVEGRVETAGKIGRSRARVGVLITSAGLAAGLAPMTMAANTTPLGGSSDAATSDAFHAATLAFESGRLLVAQKLLDDAGLTGKQADQLASRIARSLRGLSTAGLSVERLDLAVATGDLRTASRLATSLAKADVSDMMSDRVEALRAQLTTAIDATRELADATASNAFDQIALGDYTRAKSLVAQADRMAPALSRGGRARLEAARSMVIDEEIARGEVFGVDTVAASLLDQPADDAAQPAGEQPAGDQPTADQPTAEQPTADQPAGDQPASPDDIVERSQQAAADEVYNEAESLWNEGRRRTAAERYRELLDVYGDYISPQQASLARDRVRSVGNLLGQPVEGNEPIDRRIDQIQIAADAAEREFRARMADARSALASGATEEARLNVSQAALAVNQNRIALGEEKFAQFNAETEALLIEIRQEEERLRAEESRRQSEEIAAANRRTSEELARNRERQVVEALDRARELQSELKYEEAREVIEQALFLDPANPAALLIRDVLDDILIYNQYQNIQRRKTRAMSELSIDNLEASIAPTDVITYPTDWPTLSYRRTELAQIALSSDDKRVLARLDNTRISPSFRDDTLADAIEFVREVAQVNVDVNWRSLEEIGVTRQTPVDLRLDSIPAGVVLDRVLAKVSDPIAPAGWSVKDGVVTVGSQSLLDRDTETLVYDVRDLLVEIPDYEELPALDLDDVLRSASRTGRDLGVDPFSVEGVVGGDLERKPDRVDEIISVIRQNIDFDSWQANGGSVGNIQDLNGSLVVTTTPKNHRQVSGLLTRLREFRAMQINVEARFLTIDQAYFEQLGFDVDVTFNADNNQVQTAQAANPSIVGSDFINTTGNSATGANATTVGAGLGSPVIVTDAAGNPIPDGNGGVVTFTPTTTTQVVGPDGGFTPVGTTSNSLGISETLVTGLSGDGFAADILGAGPALGIAGRFLDDVQVDFLVKATQADQRSSQLTAPRLTFSNGQTANVQVATQRAFVSGLTPVVGTSAVGFDPQVGVLTEGVTLGVEGTVSADRRYVTLSVQTGTNIFNGFEQAAVTAVAGGEAISSADVSSFIQLPTVTVTQVETTVTVPDQGTVLLGGQRVVNEFEVESGVPVLSKIPIINRFFTNRIESTDEQTLLVLIKPTILIQNEEEENRFPGLLDSLRSDFGG